MIISFLICLSIIALIGISSYKYSKPNAKDYYLASQSLNPWLAGLSAMATNNSGYMFIGLIGFTYTVGLSSIWLMVGWILGDFLISKFIHQKINEQTKKTKKHTYASVLGAWSNQKDNLTKFIALVSLIFLIVYASAQFVSGGKTLVAIFNWELTTGIFIGSMIVLAYTLVGGIRASIWTDAMQAFIMIFSMLSLVVIGLIAVGGLFSAINQWNEIPGFLEWYPSSINNTFEKIIYPLSWLIAGIFIIGQPHIMVRFMALKKSSLINKARFHYYFWYTFFYFLAFSVGMLSRILINNYSGFDPELALPLIAVDLLNPFVVGIVIAGIFAATMSTADSLIINCSGNISQDLLNKKKLSSFQIKMMTLLVALASILISLFNNDSVFLIVVYAWTLLGISFAPLIIVLASECTISFKDFLIGLLIGYLTLYVVNHYSINNLIYSGFIPFCTNLFYLWLKRTQIKI